ncbi:MAG: alpha/beta fold hydrolase [Sphingomicrobium sp.]
MGAIKTSKGAVGVVENGCGNSVPIVFLHGVGSDKSVWAPQLAYFGQTRRAVAFDYPGYGESDRAPDSTTRDDYAVAILSAMDALEIDQAHICGLSLGGIVAIALYHAAAGRCASLIIADSFVAHPDGQAIYDRSIAGSADMRALAEARADFLLAQPAAAAVRAEVIETMSRIDPAGYRIGAKAVWLANQEDRVRQICTPALILCGDQDLPTPPSLSREMHSLIPNSRLEIISNAGHLTNIEQPDEFNRLVDEFVMTVDARAQAIKTA